MTLVVAIGPSSFAEKDPTPLSLLKEAGVEIKPNPFGRRLTEEEIIAHLEGVDGLIAGLEPLNRKVLSSASPRLQALARVGIGMDNVDSQAARELGIAVSNTPDPPAIAVAELTLSALLSLARQLGPSNNALHRGEWKKIIGKGLVGAQVLIVGYGRIGRRVAHLLRAFGAEILVHDPFLEEGSLNVGENVISLEEGLAVAEVISLHASGKETILGPEEFARMREGVVLLNSARGELVDEDALVAALSTGKVAGAWFDAFWKEPYQGPLASFDQVLLTPHVGTYTEQCRLEMESQAARNLLKDLGL
jgi:D-3-phosphoglycerate dehydrogenase